MPRMVAPKIAEGVDEKPKCLTCDERAVNRGLCRTCYTAAYRSVVKKETTWRKLERKGFAIPKGKRRVVSRWKRATGQMEQSANG